MVTDFSKGFLWWRGAKEKAPEKHQPPPHQRFTQKVPSKDGSELEKKTKELSTLVDNLEAGVKEAGTNQCKEKK